MQPSVATSSPLLGVAITSILPVPGCFTGVSSASQIDSVGRFVIEVAQGYTKGKSNIFLIQMNLLRFKTLWIDGEFTKITRSTMKNILLVSNSTCFGQGYLDHCETEIRSLLGNRKTLLFVPYALHDHDGYAKQ